MSINALNTILPLFGVMLAGYLFERFRILKRGSSEILSGFVFLVSLPALIFISLARVPVGEFFNWPFLGALGGGMLAMFAISLLIARTVFPESLTANGLHALAATFSSTGYVGLPLVLIVFGETVLVPGIIGVVLPVALLMPLAIIIAEADKCRDGGRILQASLRGLIRNPMIVATIAGLLVSWSGIFIPEAIANGFQLLGDAFIPCSLFSAGLFMAGATVKGERVEVGWVVLTKLVLHPLLTFWLAYWVLKLEEPLAAIAVIMAAVPTGVTVFILAQQYGAFVARSNAVIVVSTVLSLVTLTSLIAILGR
ncbi:putative Malonate transporter [Candidatus Filomicrobium marinum]|uniref:AEC family transporter n=2 Tax=Filomicrobium TaxID=119044 RepID=A0A1H0PXE1_9HYPH|nr:MULTISPECIES: AEC family transporter [Filomicrobium]MCV0369862.1 AEC family transporter [Filomicrobium sp.]CFX52231.1 putative Malonate transporter [Candidatus Filomicrobium marinum]CPR20047.1 putative Malonate transporter [Candidatus Filomicrobium marinum]SDP09206.1 hypothetical protein SAMN04488061_2167 [Filomicrobium insigne]